MNNNIYENTIDDTKKQENMLNYLKNEIEKIKTQITETEQKQNMIVLEGMPSVKDGMISLAHLPIGTFIAIMILSGSPLLGLYFAVPLTGILLLFSAISNKYFKECLAEKESYAAIVEYLKEELNDKINKQEQLKKCLSFSENIVTYEECEKTKKAREKMINLLKLYRKRIVYTYFLDKDLEEIGVSKEEVCPTKEETARVLRIEKSDEC